MYPSITSFQGRPCPHPGESVPQADLPLSQFLPRSELVTPVSNVTRARFPAIDAHNHLGHLGDGLEDAPSRLTSPQQLRDQLDHHNIRGIVDLDGRASRLEQALEYKRALPGRVAVLHVPDWSTCQTAGWPAKLPETFRSALAHGLDGLKISKALGLIARDESGTLLRLDDPRLADLWDTAGDAGVPVLIHVADPVAFFRPIDGRNERWDELHLRPDWSWHGPQYPSFEDLMDQLLALVQAHPCTTFQVAHVGAYAENLGWVGEQLLRPHPNVVVDISERIAELGRQPHAARRFLIEFQERIVFGTDRPPLGPWYPYYFRFLETLDDYFPHGPEEPPRQGRWNISGVGLPDDVLRRIYATNAERLYPTLAG